MRKRGLTLLAALMAFGVGDDAAADSLSEAFKRVKSSVVVVRTTQKEIMPQSGGQLVSVAGLGSGVLISADGKVLTAAHVVQTAEMVEVEFDDGDIIAAQVLGSVPAADVAILQLELPPPAEIHKAKLSDSDEVEVGDPVFVVGAPLGITYSLTAGHISGRRQPDKMLGDFYLAEFFQTDAAINQGNSGGPMFDMKGEVIGIVSHILSQSGGFEGLGFVVTSNTARALLLESRPVWTGMEGVLLAGEMARVFNVPGPAGMLVQRIASGSLSAKLGLEPGRYEATIEGQPILLGGDIVLSVMGVPLGDAESFMLIRERAAALKPGDTVRVTILRGGQQVELSTARP
jgi:S1-C subfamily serine protease